MSSSIDGCVPARTPKLYWGTCYSSIETSTSAYLVDGGKACIILGALVTIADVMDNMPFLDLLWRACFLWQLTGDTTCGTIELIRALEDAELQAYVPLTDWDKRTSLFGREAFIYDAEADHYMCPNGAIVRRDRHDYVKQIHHYRADAATCNAYGLKAKCTKSNEDRTIRRRFFRSIWTGWQPITKLRQLLAGRRRRIRSARFGSRYCSVKASSGMAWNDSGYITWEGELRGSANGNGTNHHTAGVMARLGTPPLAWRGPRSRPSPK